MDGVNMKTKDIDEPATESSEQVSLPREIVDGITLNSLKDTYAHLTKELNDHIVNGTYLHPEDVKGNHQLLYCLKVLIEYYGGDVEDATRIR